MHVQTSQLKLEISFKRQTSQKACNLFNLFRRHQMVVRTGLDDHLIIRFRLQFLFHSTGYSHPYLRSDGVWNALMDHPFQLFRHGEPAFNLESTMNEWRDEKTYLMNKLFRSFNHMIMLPSEFLAYSKIYQQDVCLQTRLPDQTRLQWLYQSLPKDRTWNQQMSILDSGQDCYANPLNRY